MVETFFQIRELRGLNQLLKGRLLSSCGNNIYNFSQDDVSLHFHKFYLRSFMAEKGVKFLLPSKLEKNRPF